MFTSIETEVLAAMMFRNPQEWEVNELPLFTFTVTANALRIACYLQFPCSEPCMQSLGNNISAHSQQPDGELHEYEAGEGEIQFWQTTSANKSSILWSSGKFGLPAWREAYKKRWKREAKKESFRIFPIIWRWMLLFSIFLLNTFLLKFSTNIQADYPWIKLP